MIYLAQELQFDKKIITDFKIVNYQHLKRHELVVEDRFQSLTLYLKSLQPYIILPSILVCDKTNVIIDGHHRFSALLEMGVTDIPVTYIDYNHPNIITHLESTITKEEIILAAQNSNLLNPKSTFHHIKTDTGKYYPIILLSSLFSIDNIYS